ncbi:2-oxo acid dehydrogenase subunit E2 [Dehalococcoidia bacterium]|nr:2-oxo acid dehydrogenase subunit E2 [Dehalococcoidia bacterium]
MSVTIQLPQVGESVTEGIIAKWLKQVGDTVEKYESLVEVVTDKVNMEVPSPFSGTITALLAKEGDVIEMGAPIAEMDTTDALSLPNRQNSITTPIGRNGVLLKDIRPVGPTGSGEEPPIPEIMISQRYDVPKTPDEMSPGLDSQRYSPVVRRLANERGVDLRSVSGTGRDGRITKEDVLRYIDQTHNMSSGAGTDEELAVLSPMRRLIAANMLNSSTQIPQAWSSVEVDMTSIIACREDIKAEFLRREGIALTYIPIIIKVVIECIQHHPLINSVWGEDKVIIKKRKNIGIAVAAPQGLIVPVIHDADTLSFAGLARACDDLIRRARDGRLKLADVQGGTFTINNTGALGSVISRPLVNPPQAAILTTELIVKRPVVINGDAIAIRSMMNLCISFDHRIMDGAEVSAFMSSTKQGLEAVGLSTPLY